MADDVTQLRDRRLVSAGRRAVGAALLAWAQATGKARPDLDGNELFDVIAALAWLRQRPRTPSAPSACSRGLPARSWQARAGIARPNAQGTHILGTTWTQTPRKSLIRWRARQESNLYTRKFTPNSAEFPRR